MTTYPTDAYRADIDGLRAVAVLAVVGSHAGVPFLGGGWVGVDIFFVISGYLITSILHRELSEDRFSFPRFYYRRARRILPALLLVLTATLVAGYFVLLPRDYRELGVTARAAGLFFPNFYFAAQTGYFDIARNLKPLLMTWSLGVEEQFYAAFPLVMFALHKLRARKWLWLGIGLAASLAWCIHAVPQDPKANYFLPQFRAWELLTGACLVWLPRHSARRQGIDNALSVGGLALIGYAVFTLSDHALFPGWLAVPPVLGTALLIRAGKGAWVNRLLALRPLVFVGAISYALYLWHWPLLSFAYHLRPANDLPLSITLPLMGIAALLAAVSTFGMELPLRRGTTARPFRALVAYAVATLAVVSLGHNVSVRRGLPERLPPAIHTALTRREQDHIPRFQDCELDQPNGTQNRMGSQCPEPGRHRNTIFVWGDSHARAIAPGFADWARVHGWAYALYAEPGCTPLPGTERTASAGVVGWTECEPVIRRGWEYARDNSDVKIVVIA
ncbi:MAG TPA: acyltransferase family protein, partial [bacterium]